MIFQVGISEITKYNLDDRTLGRYSFMVDGRPSGFYKSRTSAEGAFGKQLAAEWFEKNRSRQ